MYWALGAVFLIISLAVAAGIIAVAVLSAKNGKEVITTKNIFYLAPAFLIIYFLHVTAAAFSGKTIDFFYCFTLVNDVFDFLKFKAQGELISALCREYPIFYADFILAFLVGVASVILSVACLFGRRINNYIKIKNYLKNSCDIVLGDSPDAIDYVKNTKNCVLVATDVTNRRYAEIIKQVPALKVPLDADALSAKLKNGGHHIIVFRDSDYSYTKIIKTFTKFKDVCEIYLEANQQEMKILKEKFITKAEKNSNLFITGFSKYELIARRFVVDYPITKFIPRTFYNENCSLKSEKEINVVFIGFGKVNYQLFRMCAMQFQFAQEKEGKLASKPVNFHIYDNNADALHNEFFSRILFEFNEEFKYCDFPKPEKICNIVVRPLDINSVAAKKEFKEMVNENSFTYFVISLENDLQDASYAQTVKRLFGADGNFKIFVRARNKSDEKLNELDERVTYFGEEKKLYTHENIINDDLTELAKRINLLYREITDAPEWLTNMQKEAEGLSGEQQRALLTKTLADAENLKYMQDVWYNLPYIEKASNLYHAMNLPFKLNLLGFDMVKKSNEKDTGIEEEEFNKYYINSGREIKYKDYSFFFKTESSNVLAYIEHSRWNALYILYDFKQMKKADMKVSEETDKNGETQKVMPHKDLNLKQHACLTTYYGLNDLLLFKFKTMYPDAEFNALDEKVFKLGKIYRYDYMDLDRLYGEIAAIGYKLVPQSCNNS